MADPYVGEIRMLACNFAPTGWAFCNGQLLPISQSTALFSLLGVNFGGDGRTNFGLPNLPGSVPLGAGQGPGLTARDLGESGGEAAVTLGPSQVPGHGHSLQAFSRDGDSTQPGTASSLARSSPGIYKQPAGAASPQQMSSQILGTPVGGEPTAQQPAAVPDAELLHCAAGHLPATLMT